MPACQSSNLLRELHSLTAGDRESAGGKAATLALLAREGFAVPRGWCC